MLKPNKGVMRLERMEEGRYLNVADEVKIA